MICQSCRERHHEDCRGGSWCDCQHKPGSGAPASGAERRAGPPTGGRAEPPVNWRRQG
ncbi:hypothetical protein BKA00_003099 [Actinomadura coerulea]|uniref:Uncharacterized protein n=1 Tax=Actinomadura coerulea TaxID=46159 RepID=A0A7X0FYP0_9ACTN|nr:hypothetical protein [Actinomadura coerulea]MBB6396185.1 hypothetical protein [Actinomadura coerulea]